MLFLLSQFIVFLFSPEMEKGMVLRRKIVVILDRLIREDLMENMPFVERSKSW